jgi:SsrA-binding protein
MTTKKNSVNNNVNIKNKKASFEFEFIDVYTAGMVLTGTEIKSIRDSKASIAEGFCVFEKGELFIRNMFVSEYFDGTYNNHPTKRDRKLLLNKSELKKLEAKVKEKGLTIIPLKLFLNEKGIAKLQIALAKGKKIYDKRDSLKEKSVKRDMDRALSKD